MKNAMTFLAIVLLLTAGAYAERRTVDRTVEMSATGTVEIDALAADITIKVWDQARVQVTGKLGESVEELDIDADGTDVEIDIDVDEGYYHSRHGEHGDHGNHKMTWGKAGGTELVVMVPRGAQIELDGISVDLEVTGVQGGLEIEVISGDVNLVEVAGELDIEMVSGKLEIDASAGGVSSGDFKTVSGRIVFRGPLAPGGDYSFETVQGSVTLELMGDVSAHFEVETFNGKIVNDFGLEVERMSQWTPQSMLEGSVGGGSASVSIDCFGGKVELLRR